MESGYLGAVTHAVLALAGVYEGVTGKTRTRKFLAGAVIGWHLFATMYHVKERLRAKEKTECSHF